MKKNKMGLEIAGGAIIYKVFVANEEIGTYDNFGKAFKAFYDKIADLLTDEEQISETGCWINYDLQFRLDFYRVVKIAYILGLMKDSRIVKTETSPEEEVSIRIGLQLAAGLSSIC